MSDTYASAPPPPESWPGAHGRRSHAPDVPSWPRAALDSPGTAQAAAAADSAAPGWTPNRSASTRPPRGHADPGASWPGAERGSQVHGEADPDSSSPGAATAGPPAREATPPRLGRDALEEGLDDAAASGGVAGVLFPALAVLVAIGLVGLWTAMDGEHRPVQRIVVIAVAVIAVGALAVSAYRHRSRG